MGVRGVGASSGGTAWSGTSSVGAGMIGWCGSGAGGGCGTRAPGREGGGRDALPDAGQPGHLRGPGQRRRQRAEGAGHARHPCVEIAPGDPVGRGGQLARHVGGHDRLAGEPQAQAEQGQEDERHQHGLLEGRDRLERRPDRRGEHRHRPVDPGQREGAGPERRGLQEEQRDPGQAGNRRDRPEAASIDHRARGAHGGVHDDGGLGGREGRRPASPRRR